MRIIWLIVGVVLAGLLIGWWATRGLMTTAPQESSPARPETNDVSPTVALAASPESVFALSMSNVAGTNPRLKRTRVARSEPGNAITNWQDKVEAILSSQEQDAGKARQMLALFPDLPVDGQVEVAQYLAQLLPDENYLGLGAYATNSSMAQPVQQVLLAGLLSRPDEIKLPLLLAIAEDQQHTQHEQARNLLEGFLGQDYGADWDQWTAGVQQRLQGQSMNQPDQSQDQQMSEPGSTE